MSYDPSYGNYEDPGLEPASEVAFWRAGVPMDSQVGRTFAALPRGVSSVQQPYEVGPRTETRDR
jgi:hypothetical protein